MTAFFFLFRKFLAWFLLGLAIMIAALTDCRLREYPPDFLIRPELPAEVTLLTGFGRAEEIIAAGEKAAEEALPQIRTLFL